MNNEVQTYMDQFVAHYLYMYKYKFWDKLHLNKYIPHEAQKYEHATRYYVWKACKLN